MLDMSWGEVMLIGGVALIVIGPKDLPKALRTVGQVTTKLRRMAGEFQMQFSEAIREAELDEVRKEVDGLRDTVRTGSGFNPVQTIRDELKGAVEGRAKAQGGAAAALGLPASATDPAAGVMGPVRPEPASPAAPPPEPEVAPEGGAERGSEVRSLADATARLRAEQGSAERDSDARDSDAPGAAHAAPAADEPPLPVPGSVDDPYGMPPDPEPPGAPARPAATAPASAQGSAAR